MENMQVNLSMSFNKISTLTYKFLWIFNKHKSEHNSLLHPYINLVISLTI